MVVSRSSGQPNCPNKDEFNKEFLLKNRTWGPYFLALTNSNAILKAVHLSGIKSAQLIGVPGAMLGQGRKEAGQMAMVQEMLRVPAGSRMIILSRGIDGITHNALSFIDLLRAYPHLQIVLVFAEQVSEAPRSLAWRRYNTMDYIVCPLKILVDHLLGRLVDSKCTELCERWHSINKTKKGIGSAIEQHCKKELHGAGIIL
jgi:hypothetical protein